MPPLLHRLPHADRINISTLCRDRRTQQFLQILLFLFGVVAILGSMKSNPAFVTVFGILAALVGLLAAFLGLCIPPIPERRGITAASQHDNGAALQGPSDLSRSQSSNSSYTMDAPSVHIIIFQGLKTSTRHGILALVSTTPYETEHFMFDEFLLRDQTSPELFRFSPGDFSPLRHWDATMLNPNLGAKLEETKLQPYA
ncbi:uncharacterized protein ARMOST_12194 [Armillaria ostoyae]|uniref:Uncharacterized protein n=1 Tax=Armillaria ostoyae TaxID=47428 RepID=A0A284RJA2_ARMOS|nr:uncharacterized protein ARMOST_12194 [Armillaria ostoyae]